MPKLRVIGAGRAGMSLHGALTRAGWQTEEPLRRGDDVRGAAADVDLVVIATPDAAVAEIAALIDPVAGAVVAHLSGALGLDVLAPHVRRAAIHPLVALRSPESGAERLGQDAWFAVAGDDLARTVVADLGGHCMEVGDEDRPKYHAAACIAANHLVALLGQVDRIASGLGLPLEPFVDLARGALDDVDHVGPAVALTGPVERRDWETIARHRAALAGNERALYDALCGAALRLSTGDGTDPRPLHRLGTVAGFQAALDAERAAGRSIGLVPTMGYLHEGHASLVRRAAAECDVVAVTVFVNPLQFAATEDLSTYPRDIERDAAVAAESGATYLFAPTVEEMYPAGVATTVAVHGLTETMEGAIRPSHFDGVATVVAKLFAIAGRCRAYFGEKDFQQLAVVRTMAADLSFPVEVVGCPIVRDPDGLALSSRNVYLSTRERAAATVLSRALEVGAKLVADGERDAHAVRAVLEATIEAEPLAALDYAAVVDSTTLEPLTAIDRDGRMLVAARVGRTRLLDNAGVTV